MHHACLLYVVRSPDQPPKEFQRLLTHIRGALRGIPKIRNYIQIQEPATPGTVGSLLMDSSAAPRFDETIKEEIRSRADIAAVVGRYVNLKSSGQNLKGLCPFHKEKTPSFVVNQARGTYYCFGCGKGGDVFSFLMEMDGVGFGEALRMLADETGVRLETRAAGHSPNTPQTPLPPRAEMLRLHEIAVRFYYGSIKAHPRAVEYFKARGLTGETVRDFLLGYAPPGWSNFVSFAKSSGIPESALLGCGLAVTKAEGGQAYDRFRDRIIFPICDLSGRPIALAGRGMSEDNMPKYLNSPETPLYRKSRTLYGLHKSRSYIKEERCVLIVEGYMDFLSLFQAGIRNLAATCGTALTPEHCQLLGRFTSRVILVFDGDTAGKNAAQRGVMTLAPSGLDTRVLILPDEEDPDSYVRKHGVQKFSELTANAQGSWDFIIDALEAECGTNPHGKAAIVSRLSPLIQGMSDPVIRDQFVKLLGERLSLSAAVIMEKVGTAPREEASSQPASSFSAQHYLMTPEGKLIRLLLQYPELHPRVSPRLGPDSFMDRFSAELYSTVIKQVTMGVEVGRLVTAVDNPDMARIFALLSVSQPSEGENAEAELEHTIRQLERKHLKHQLSLLRRRMSQKPADYEALRKEQYRITTLLGEMSSKQ